MTILIAVILLIIGILPETVDHWHSQIMFGEFGVMAYLSYELFKRVHYLPALVLFYFSTYSIYCSFRKTIFLAPGFDVQTIMDVATARSLGFLLLATIPFIFVSKNDISDWLKGFKAFAVVNALVMIGNRYFTGAATGMIGMDSVDGAFLAVILPSFFVKPLRRDGALWILILAIALFLTRSSTVFGVLCLYALVLSILKIKKNENKIVASILIVALTIPAGGAYLKKDLFEDNGRIGILKKAWHAFKQTDTGIGHYLFGLGSGSFLVMSQFIQDTTHVFFIWLHNEPAQVFFEQGIVGFMLILVTYAEGLFKQRKDLPRFFMLLGAGFQCFLQPCFRYFLFAIFLAFLMRLSFDENTNNERTPV